MREKSYQQIRVISCHDPTEFQRQFNAAQEELATKNPRVEFNMAQGHCAYIIYNETVYTPETAEDEFSQAGISYHCRNCPKFEWPMTQAGAINHVKKLGKCPITPQGATYRNSPACEYLYKGILNGSIEAIQDDELEEFQLR